MTDSRTPVIQATALVKRVSSGESALQIVDNISLSIVEGESVAIVGVSGSGKSTLLGLLAGLDQPTSGEITLDGTRLDALDEDERAALRNGRVGFVFQNFQLLAGLNAVDNVLLPLELSSNTQNESSEALRARADEALASVGLTDRAMHFPSQLSGGEQQRVALARAFAPQPRILFADEPTGNLDRDTGERVVDLMMTMNAERGTTLLVVTHDERLAERCDRSLRIDAGALVDAHA